MDSLSTDNPAIRRIHLSDGSVVQINLDDLYFEKLIIEKLKIRDKDAVQMRKSGLLAAKLGAEFITSGRELLRHIESQMRPGNVVRSGDQTCETPKSTSTKRKSPKTST